jgi:hypothetical protein
MLTVLDCFLDGKPLEVLQNVPPKLYFWTSSSMHCIPFCIFNFCMSWCGLRPNWFVFPALFNAYRSLPILQLENFTLQIDFRWEMIMKP